VRQRARPAIACLVGLFVVVTAGGRDAVLDARRAAADLYVAPNGAPGNPGTEASPLDLTTALSQTSPARAGDTIWLRGGVYRGTFTSVLTGTSSAPITVRQYPGERATIDSAPSAEPALTLKGAWTRYWGFEIMSSDPNRRSPTAGTPPDLRRGAGISALGPNLSLINLIVHDMGPAGLGIANGSDNTEAYGNVIYANGWLGPDRGHGHGIYTQNRLGVRRIADNVIFNQFSHGVHAYGSAAAFLNNIELEGNIIFNNGVYQATVYEPNILIGGDSVAQNPVALSNYTYINSDRTLGKANNFGYAAGCTNLVARDNYWAHLTVNTFAVVNCTGDIRNNFILGYIEPIYLTQYPHNEMHPVVNKNYAAARPTGVRVFVRPNRYEPGRANIAVYNWDLRAAVDINLAAAGLAPGAVYEIRDAQDYFGAPVLSGTYGGGSVAVPMTRTTVSRTIGDVATPPHTTSEFGAFIVLPLDQPPPATAPTASLTATPTIIDQGASATLSWSTSNATSVSIDQNIGGVPATGTRSVTPAATTTYTLTATNATGSTVRTVTVTVRPPVTAGAAVFQGTDTTTQGTWLAAYGTQGHYLVGATAELSASTEVSVTNGSPYTWSASTTDIRALQRPSGTGRFAATWYHPQSFSITVGINDGVARRVSLYSLDWDRVGRQQRIDVRDAVTGVVLDTRTLSSFGNGQFSSWQISGRVTFTMTRLAGPNAVISGIFIDGAGSTPPPATVATPSFSPAGGTFTAPVSVAISTVTAGAQIRYTTDGTTPTASSTLYTAPLNIATSTTVQARAFAAGMTDSAVATAAYVVSTSSGGTTTSATFAGVDASTVGNWRGVYGAEGYTLANDGTALSASVQVTLSNGWPYTWSSNTTDTRALERASGAGRIAATWYNASALTIRVRNTSGASRRIALYALDWDRVGRQQRITIRDTATGAVLDTRDWSGFGGGQYLVWHVAGDVTITVSRLAGPNAVISGVFVQ
jgi:hypothetical protein